LTINTISNAINKAKAINVIKCQIKEHVDARTVGKQHTEKNILLKI
jgi:hypothetical protein